MKKFLFLPIVLFGAIVTIEAKEKAGASGPYGPEVLGSSAAHVEGRRKEPRGLEIRFSLQDELGRIAAIAGDMGRKIAELQNLKRAQLEEKLKQLGSDREFTKGVMRLKYVLVFDRPERKKLVGRVKDMVFKERAGGSGSHGPEVTGFPVLGSPQKPFLHKPDRIAALKTAIADDDREIAKLDLGKIAVVAGEMGKKIAKMQDFKQAQLGEYLKQLYADKEFVDGVVLLDRALMLHFLKRAHSEDLSARTTHVNDHVKDVVYK